MGCVGNVGQYTALRCTYWAAVCSRAITTVVATNRLDLGVIAPNVFREMKTFFESAAGRAKVDPVKNASAFLLADRIFYQFDWSKERVLANWLAQITDFLPKLGQPRQLDSEELTTATELGLFLIRLAQAGDMAAYERAMGEGVEVEPI